MTQLLDPQSYTKWTDRLALDIALRLEGSWEVISELMLRHNISRANLKDFNKDPLFLNKIAALRNEVRDRGITFKLKAKSQAEELLTTYWLLIHSPETSAAVKADLIKSTVKWAGLEPRSDNIGDIDTGGGVRITINLGPSNAEPRVIEGIAKELPDAQAA